MTDKEFEPLKDKILLGHSNLATTSIYTRARPKDALESYERLFQDG